MATIAEPTTRSETDQGVRPWRFSVDDFDRMAEVGILPPKARVELIEGEILAMSPIGRWHAGIVDRLIDLLVGHLGARAKLRVQGPFRLDDQSEPQPDLMLLRPRADFYTSGLPTAADVLLLIEVMDSSAGFDRGVKLTLYARAGVPEVWLVDLNGDRVETYRRPEGGSYTQTQTLARGQSFAAEALAGALMSVDAILG
jgi:Uma2 family endonuclease